jgi:hypothetical protein
MIQCLLLFLPAHIFHRSWSLKRCVFWSLTFARKTFWASVSHNFVLQPSSCILFPDYAVTPTTCTPYQCKLENEDWADGPGWIHHKLRLCATFALVWANSSQTFMKNMTKCLNINVHLILHTLWSNLIASNHKYKNFCKCFQIYSSWGHPILRSPSRSSCPLWIA